MLGVFGLEAKDRRTALVWVIRVDHAQRVRKPISGQGAHDMSYKGLAPYANGDCLSILLCVFHLPSTRPDSPGTKARSVALLSLFYHS